MELNLDKINDEILNLILKISAIFVLPMGVLSMQRLISSSTIIDSGFHVLFITLVLALFFVRNILSFTLKYRLFFLLEYSLIIYGISKLGPVGLWGYVSIVAIFISGLFFERKDSKLFLALTFVAILSALFIYVSKISSTPDNTIHAVYTDSYWFFVFFMLLFVASVLILATRKKRYFFIESLKKLEQQKQQVDKRAELEEAQKALLQSEMHYRELFDNANDAILWVELDTGTIIKANKAAEKLTQIAKDELIGLHHTQLYANQTKEKAEQSFNLHRQDTEPKTGYVTIEPQKGNKRDIEIRASLTTVGDKKIVQGIFRDITNDKKNELELKKLNEVQRIVLDAFDEGIYMNDKDFTIYYANRAIRDKIGFDPIGKKCYNVLYSKNEKCSWCGFNALEKQRKNEYILNKDDGQTIIVKNKLLSDNSKLTIFQNITNVLKKEQELEKLSTIVEQNPASIVITNLNGDIEYVNKQFTIATGYNKHEVVGQNPRIIKSENTNPETYQNLWKTISEGKTWEGEFLTTSKKGTKFWEKALIGPIIDKNGQKISYVAIKQDITAEKVAQQKIQQQNNELKELNDLKNKLFSIIGHDLKNPFHSLLGFSELLLDKYNQYDDPKRLKFIAIIQDNAKKGYRLLEDLLEWAQTQNNTRQHRPSLFQLNQLLTETIDFASENARQKNIDLFLEFPQNPVNVFADYNMIKTTIRNLISNAIKFTPSFGQITLRVENSDNDKVNVLIKDTGVGMTEQQMANLFKIGETKTTVGTSGEKGTGLGLLLCNEFVKMHNSQIVVISKPEQGSTFSFELAKGDETQI